MPLVSARGIRPLRRSYAGEKELRSFRPFDEERPPRGMDWRCHHRVCGRREQGDSGIVDDVLVGHDRNLESALVFRFLEGKKDEENRFPTDGATDLTG